MQSTGNFRHSNLKLKEQFGVAFLFDRQRITDVIASSGLVLTAATELGHTPSTLWTHTWHSIDTHLHKLCIGSLRSMWGQEGAFSSLTILFLADNPLSGTLPAEWGGINSWPALQQLELGASSSLSPPSRLSGAFPPEWGSPSAFPQLTRLLIYNTLITGKWQTLTAS